MQEAAVAAPGVSPELEAAEALGRKWGAREERLLPCRERERRAGQLERTELPNTIRRLWERSRERRAGREENWEDSSRDSRLWLGTWKERGTEELQSPQFK